MRGQQAQVTGTIYLAGEHLKRDDVRAKMRAMGAGLVPLSSRSRGMTLLVVGELRPGQEQQLAFVLSERNAGNHIHVVDNAGLTDLLAERTASCMELTRGTISGTIAVRREAVQPSATTLSESGVSTAAEATIPPTLGATHAEQAGSAEADGPAACVGSSLPVLGELVAARAIPTHSIVELALDLTKLDRGTEAHERTVIALRDHLAPTSVRTAGPGMPGFDLGWESADGTVMNVAEVKSLPAGRQTQQIRLGIGQVLGYAQQVRDGGTRSTAQVVAVLVLEREPDENYWVRVAAGAGIILTWGPNFPGLA